MIICYDALFCNKPDSQYLWDLTQLRNNMITTGTNRAIFGTLDRMLVRTPLSGDLKQRGKRLAKPQDDETLDTDKQG